MDYYSPSLLEIEILKNTYINLTIKDKEELNFFNKRVDKGDKLQFTFDDEIKFDLLNASHLRAYLNGLSLDSYFTKNNVKIRGSYIVKKSQLYIGYYNDNQNQLIGD